MREAHYAHHTLHVCAAKAREPRREKAKPLGIRHALMLIWYYLLERTRRFYPGGNMTLYEQVSEAVASIQARTTLKPAIALILGSGLGDIAAEVHDARSIPYTEIPHFAHSTVPGHAGRLLLGMFEGLATVVMQGRFHFYEGYSLQAITLPV